MAITTSVLTNSGTLTKPELGSIPTLFNENYADVLGVKEIILPKGGYRSQERIKHERKRNFKKARRWHNGVEGRISFLKRCFGLQRCLYKGESGFSRWVGLGIIAHNLTIISRVTTTI